MSTFRRNKSHHYKSRTSKSSNPFSIFDQIQIQEFKASLEN
jgi:hypothetical protein